MWSAVVDARVLTVRALPFAGTGACSFDAHTDVVRIVCGPDAEHLLVDRGGVRVRLDVIDGTVLAGPVTLRFYLHDDDRLGAQLSALHAFRDPARATRSHVRLAHGLLDLQTVDARDDGASLREVADLVLGVGPWPGDGDHRKSLVRRMIVAGDRMIRAGPANVLVDRPRRS